MSAQRKLTPKQERFAQLMVTAGSGKEAAIKAGYPEKAAKEVAYENLTKPHLVEAIEANKEALRTRNRESEDSILAELNELKQLAVNQGNIGSAIKAVDSKTSILGLNKEPAANPKELEGSMDTIIDSVLPTLYARIVQRRDAGEVIALPWE